MTDQREDQIRERAAAMGFELRPSTDGYMLIKGSNEIDLNDKSLDEIDAYLNLHHAIALVNENEELIDSSSNPFEGRETKH